MAIFVVGVLLVWFGGWCCHDVIGARNRRVKKVSLYCAIKFRLTSLLGARVLLNGRDVFAFELDAVRQRVGSLR